MNSLIFSTLVRLLLPVLLIISIAVMYRGHNLPGGGFIGGLVAAAAIILVAMAEGRPRAVQVLRVEPTSLLVAGIATSLGSAALASLLGGAFMTGQWLPSFWLPLLGTLHLGTPVLFDVGVYLVVVGFGVLTTFSLMEAAAE